MHLAYDIVLPEYGYLTLFVVVLHSIFFEPMSMSAISAMESPSIKVCSKSIFPFSDSVLQYSQICLKSTVDVLLV